MRVMAVDLGDARTGVAVSDITGTLAGDAFTISEWNMDAAARRIAAEAEARGAGTVVVGLPRNMDGTLGPRAEKCTDFAEKLKTLCTAKIVMWDERRTTVDAHRILSDSGKKMKKHREKVDAVAAALILEGYLGSL